MNSFKGFIEYKERTTAIPQEFFSEILPQISDLYELKTLLYLFWYFENNEYQYPIITLNALRKDPLFLSGLGKNESDQYNNLQSCINRLKEDKLLLYLQIEYHQTYHDIYILNTPQGREILELINIGAISIEPEDDFQLKLSKPQPNVFKIFEENIGVITPIIADSLKEIQERYPYEWIEEAIKEAVKNNVRKLRYIEVILKNWKDEGKYERTTKERGRKDQEEYDPDKYIDGEFSDFIDH